MLQDYVVAKEPFESRNRKESKQRLLVLSIDPDNKSSQHVPFEIFQGKDESISGEVSLQAITPRTALM